MIIFTGGEPGATLHVHAAELDDQTTFDKDGVATFDVAVEFHAVLGTAIWWNDGGSEGGVPLPRVLNDGDTVELLV